MDEKSLSHSRWDRKYHIVFAVKFRREEIYRKIKADIEKILSHYQDVAPDYPGVDYHRKCHQFDMS